MNGTAQDTTDGAAASRTSRPLQAASVDKIHSNGSAGGGPKHPAGVPTRVTTQGVTTVAPKASINQEGHSPVAPAATAGAANGKIKLDTSIDPQSPTPSPMESNGTEDEFLKRTYKSEYRKKFRPFSQYSYVDGKFQKSKLENDTGNEWYKEVLELRRQAGQYRARHGMGAVWKTMQCRGWGTETASDRMAEIYTKQADLWEQVSRRSSLQALSLAATTPSIRPMSKAEKEFENSRRSSPTKHMRTSTVPPKTKPIGVHRASPDKVDSKMASKETTPRSTPGATSAKRKQPRADNSARSPIGLPPLSKSPTKTPTTGGARTPVSSGLQNGYHHGKTGRSVSAGPENRSPKRVPKPSPPVHSTPQSAKAERRPRPTSLATSASRRKGAEGGATAPPSGEPKKPTKKPRDISASPKKSVDKKKKIEPIDDRRKKEKESKESRKEKEIPKDSTGKKSISSELRSPADKIQPITKITPAKIKSPEQTKDRISDSARPQPPIDKKEVSKIPPAIPTGDEPKSIPSEQVEAVVEQKSRRESAEPAKINLESVNQVSVTTTEPLDQVSVTTTEPLDQAAVTTTEPLDQVRVTTTELLDQVSVTTGVENVSSTLPISGTASEFSTEPIISPAVNASSVLIETVPSSSTIASSTEEVYEEKPKVSETTPVSEVMSKFSETMPVSEVMSTFSETMPVSEVMPTFSETMPVSEVMPTFSETMPVSEGNASEAVSQDLVKPQEVKPFSAKDDERYKQPIAEPEAPSVGYLEEKSTHAPILGKETTSDMETGKIDESMISSAPVTSAQKIDNEKETEQVMSSTSEEIVEDKHSVSSPKVTSPQHTDEKFEYLNSAPERTIAMEPEIKDIRDVTNQMTTSFMEGTPEETETHDYVPSKSSTVNTPVVVEVEKEIEVSALNRKMSSTLEEEEQLESLRFTSQPGEKLASMISPMSKADDVELAKLVESSSNMTQERHGDYLAESGKDVDSFISGAGIPVTSGYSNEPESFSSSMTTSTIGFENEPERFIPGPSPVDVKEEFNFSTSPMDKTQEIDTVPQSTISDMMTTSTVEVEGVPQSTTSDMMTTSMVEVEGVPQSTTSDMMTASMVEVEGVPQSTISDMMTTSMVEVKEVPQLTSDMMTASIVEVEGVSQSITSSMMTASMVEVEGVPQSTTSDMMTASMVEVEGVPQSTISDMMTASMVEVEEPSVPRAKSLETEKDSKSMDVASGLASKEDIDEIVPSVTSTSMSAAITEDGKDLENLAHSSHGEDKVDLSTSYSPTPTTLENEKELEVKMSKSIVEDKSTFEPLTSSSNIISILETESDLDSKNVDSMRISPTDIERQSDHPISTATTKSDLAIDEDSESSLIANSKMMTNTETEKELDFFTQKTSTAEIVEENITNVAISSFKDDEKDSSNFGSKQETDFPVKTEQKTASMTHDTKSDVMEEIEPMNHHEDVENETLDSSYISSYAETEVIKDHQSTERSDVTSLEMDENKDYQSTERSELTSLETKEKKDLAAEESVITSLETGEIKDHQSIERSEVTSLQTEEKKDLAAERSVVISQETEEKKDHQSTERSEVTSLQTEEIKDLQSIERSEVASLEMDEKKDYQSTERSAVTSLQIDEKKDHQSTERSEIISLETEEMKDHHSIERSEVTSLQTEEEKDYQSIERSEVTSLQTEEEKDHHSIERSEVTSLQTEEEKDYQSTERSEVTSQETGKVVDTLITSSLTYSEKEMEERIQPLDSTTLSMSSIETEKEIDYYSSTSLSTNIDTVEKQSDPYTTSSNVDFSVDVEKESQLPTASSMTTSVIETIKEETAVSDPVFGHDNDKIMPETLSSYPMDKSFVEPETINDTLMNSSIILPTVESKEAIEPVNAESKMQYVLEDEKQQEYDLTSSSKIDPISDLPAQQSTGEMKMDSESLTSISKTTPTIEMAEGMVHTTDFIDKSDPLVSDPSDEKENKADGFNSSQMMSSTNEVEELDFKTTRPVLNTEEIYDSMGTDVIKKSTTSTSERDSEVLASNMMEASSTIESRREEPGVQFDAKSVLDSSQDKLEATSFLESRESVTSLGNRDEVMTSLPDEMMTSFVAITEEPKSLTSSSMSQCSTIESKEDLEPMISSSMTASMIGTSEDIEAMMPDSLMTKIEDSEVVTQALSATLESNFESERIDNLESPVPSPTITAVVSIDEKHESFIVNPVMTAVPQDVEIVDMPINDDYEVVKNTQPEAYAADENVLLESGREESSELYRTSVPTTYESSLPSAVTGSFAPVSSSLSSSDMHAGTPAVTDSTITSVISTTTTDDNATKVRETVAISDVLSSKEALQSIPEPKDIGPRPIPGTHLKCLDDPNFLDYETTSTIAADFQTKQSLYQVLEAPDQSELGSVTDSYRVLESTSGGDGAVSQSQKSEMEMSFSGIIPSNKTTPYRVLEAPIDTQSIPIAPYRVLEDPGLVISPSSDHGAQLPPLVPPPPPGSAKDTSESLEAAREHFDSYLRGEKPHDIPEM